MKKIAIILFLFISAFVFHSSCFARSVMVRDDIPVFESKEDIESGNPLGSFDSGTIIDAYFDDAIDVNGVDYVLAIGRTFESGEAVYTKGYAEKEQLDSFYSIMKEVRTIDELSPGEIRLLMYAAGHAIEDECGVYAAANENDLILNGYIDMQVSDHCAVVSYRYEKDDISLLYKVEFLFTIDENFNGEYRTLYLEQNGKGVFGSYEPLLETDYTERLLNLSFSGFTYSE